MSKKPYADHLVWLDLESSGVDENLDHILEIGLVVSQPTYPFLELDRFTSIIVPVMPVAGDLSWIKTLDPYVAEMHAKNGLLDEIRYETIESRWADLCPAAVEAEVLDFLAPFGKRLLLAGSGVGHFDRRFLRRQMPDLEARFLFPVLDVGVIRRTMGLIGRKDLMSHQGQAVDLKPHRALDDAVIHLEEFRHYTKLFLGIPGETVPTPPMVYS